MRSSFLIFLLCALLNPLCTHCICNPPDSYERFFVNDDQARCIDNSKAAYYVRPGFGSGQDKWHIHFEGGAWCYTLSDCKTRSTTPLGSSSSYVRCIRPDYPGKFVRGYFSVSESINPPLYNFNTVLVKYCDGGSFTGNADREHEGVR
jgi:O-palmitoleoyl-L-serine hydrolase